MKMGAASTSKLSNGGGVVGVNGDGSINNAPATGKAVLSNGLNTVWRTEWYGAKWDGTTDDTAAWNATLAAWYTGGGGTIELPPNATSLILGQIIWPNNGAAIPRQPGGRLHGQGCDSDAVAGSTLPALGGTQLLMRYNGGGGPKIVTLGAGQLEISGVTFVSDVVGDTTPFLLTTNTALKVHDNAFYGDPSKSTTACQQDAIILGGTVATVGNLQTSAFQGYGTVIRENFFSHIRRAVYWRTFANGVVARDNTIWATCGSNLALGAPFEMDGGAGQIVYGNLIDGNVIEMVGYPYAVALANAVGNTVAFNNCYDESGATLGHVYCAATAPFNLVVAGAGSDATPTLTDLTAGTNTLITAHQSQRSVYAQPVTYSNTAQDSLKRKDGTNSPTGLVLEDSTGNQWMVQGWTGVNTEYQTEYIPAGGAKQLLLGMQHVSDTDYRLRIYGTTNSRIDAPSSQLVVASKTGQLLGLGDQTTVGSNIVYVLNGIITAKRGIVAGSGPTIYSGTGAPTLPGTGVASVNAGDFYFRGDTPTTANQRIYICTTGGATPVWAGIV